MGNTPFPPASPTPFAGDVPIPPMNTHTSTPNSIPTYVRDYEDAANDLMVAHMIRMMGLTSEEATAFVAMHQSVLEPFLRGVSPPPRPPTPPAPPIISTPEPLMVPPRYNNQSPRLPSYNLAESAAFLLPPPVPHAPSPVETHVSYPLLPSITQKMTLIDSPAVTGPPTHLFPCPPLPPTTYQSSEPSSKRQTIQSKPVLGTLTWSKIWPWYCMKVAASWMSPI